MHNIEGEEGVQRTQELTQVCCISWGNRRRTDSLTGVNREGTVAWQLRREANIAHGESITEKGRGKANSHGVAQVATPCTEMCDTAWRKPFGFLLPFPSHVPGINNVAACTVFQRFLKLCHQLIHTGWQVSWETVFGRSPHMDTVTSTNVGHEARLALDSALSAGERRGGQKSRRNGAQRDALALTLMLSRGEGHLKYECFVETKLINLLRSKQVI